MSLTQEITLSTLARGGLEERVQQGIAKVVENINDANTEAEVVRELTIKLKFKPDKKREAIALSGTVQTKLAAGEAITTTLFSGYDGQRFVVREHNPKQLIIDEIFEASTEDEPAPKARN